MSIVAPFRGVRYNPEKIDKAFSSVLAPPYDVINPEEQNELYGKSPHNVVRIILSKIEGDEKYAHAAETFRRWIGEEIFIQDREPCIYPYHQEFPTDGKLLTRKGFIAAVRLEDFSSKKILPHERTFSKPKLDRLKLKSACKANLSPVFMIYSDPVGTIQRAMEEKLSGNPIVVATDRDGVRNKLWRISDRDLISKIEDEMLKRNLLIADGHHRYETALEYRDIQREKHGAGSGNEPYEYVMTYLCRAEDEGLVIKPTHRVLKNLGALSINVFLKKLEERFNVERLPVNRGVPALRSVEFAIIAKDSNSILKLSSKETLSVRYKNLSVIQLHNRVFGEIINEEEAEIFYTKSLEEVISLVRDGNYKLGFLLPPLSALDVFEVSLSGEKMPHKTTYFYPKIFSGLVFHLLG